METPNPVRALRQSPLPSIKAEGVPDAEIRGRRKPSADVAPDDFALFPAAISINISPANGAGPMAARCHEGHCSAFAPIRQKASESRCDRCVASS